MIFSLTSILASLINIIFDIYFCIQWSIRSFSTGISDNLSCLVGKTAIVTGGNSGIGYAISALLASRGCKVIIATNMNAENEKQSLIKSTGNSNIMIKYLDLSKLRSIRDFAEDIKNTEDKIDILVNNAGIGISLQESTEDGLNTIMQINYFGHFLLTHLLLDKLKSSESARVVFTSSLSTMSHKLKVKYLNYISTKKSDDKDMFKAYANSKLCCMLAAQELDRRLCRFGIIVKSCDPGICLTSIYQRQSNEMMNRFILTVTCVVYLFKTDAFRAAQSAFHIAASKKLEDGSHYFRCKPFRVNKILKDKQFCQEIWDKSEELVNLEEDEKIKLYS